MTTKKTIIAKFARKPFSIEEVLNNSDPSALPEVVYIDCRKKLTASEYDEFASALLEDRDWLAGHGGYAYGVRHVVEVRAPGRPTLYVDPSGSSYGRYVGIAI